MRPFSIDYRSSRSIGRECGCTIGRACACGANQHIARGPDRYCGICKSCRNNKANKKKRGRYGQLKCVNPPLSSGDFRIVKIGSNSIRLHKDQVDYFRTKAPSLVDEPAKKFSDIVVLELYLMRQAHVHRCKEINFKIEELCEAVQPLEEELSSLRSRTLPDEELVDTMVAHKSMQRLPYKLAIKHLGEKTDRLNQEITDLKSEHSRLTFTITSRSATVIQKACRGMIARVQVYNSRVSLETQGRNESATDIQRIIRGRTGRFRAALVRRDKREKACVKIQSVTRMMLGGFTAGRRRDEIQQQEREAAAKLIHKKLRVARESELQILAEKEAIRTLEKANLDGAANTIQRIIRGHFARKTKRARRVELSLGPRVRELCNKYIAKGDLFQFLEAVNRDYELHFAQQRELRRMELENATTFINEVMAHREEQMRNSWAQWEQQKIKMKPEEKSVVTYGMKKKKTKSINPTAFNHSKADVLLQKRERELTRHVQKVPLEKLYRPLLQRSNLQCVTAVPKQIVVVPVPGCVLKDPLLNPISSTVESKSALEIGTERNRRLPQRVLENARFSGTRLLFTEISSLEEDLDTLVFLACLRCHVKTECKSEEEFERFILSAPAEIKQMAEEEAREISSLLAVNLKSKGLRTCYDVCNHRDVLENVFGVPADLAMMIRHMLGELTGSLDNVRPSLVEQKWRQALDQQTISFDSQRDQVPIHNILASDPNQNLKGHGLALVNHFPPRPSVHRVATPPAYSSFNKTRPDTVETVDYRVGIPVQALRPHSANMPGLSVDCNEPFTIERPATAGEVKYSKRLQGLTATFDLNIKALDIKESESFEKETAPTIINTIRPHSRASTAATVDWNVSSESEEFPDQDSSDSEDECEESIKPEWKHLDVICSTLKSTDPVHVLVTQIFFVSDSVNQVPYEAFMMELQEMPHEADMLRKEMIRERMRQSRDLATPIAALFENSGFHSIESLAACPLQVLGLPVHLCTQIRHVHNQLIGNNTHAETDYRYSRSVTDISSSQKEPLPPVRLRKYTEIKSVNIPIDPVKKRQLVGRVLTRGQVFSKMHVLEGQDSKNSMKLSQTYFDWKMNSKLGIDTIVATPAEAQALENWHPFPA